MVVCVGGCWLTEQPCLAISEVFTRAITVIIISTIPGLLFHGTPAPLRVASACQRRLFSFISGEGLTIVGGGGGVWEFIPREWEVLLVGIRVAKY